MQTVSNSYRSLIFLRNFSTKTMSDPYKVLRVKPNCSIDELKEAYRRMVHLYHPDGKLGNIDKFLEIKSCYD